MIKHIVFFRLAETAEGRTKIENAQIIKAGLEGLIDKVPGLKSIEVGINVPYAPQTDYDIALTCLFDTWEDLNTYATHPEHLKVAAYIGKCKTSRAACDYEV
ncbi:MAG: Dabb family protein [Paludibacteraceae bacterium]|nr:Dabb family protein [Paludibacteraceae bacterium]